MWLINTTTLGLEYFAVPERARRYAVLSHTWGNEELTFAEFRSLTGTNSDSLKDTRGYQKIRKTCELARQSNIPYVWVDTCCIDKSSSAELTEAINSMYNYYRRSDICYAYIDDWMPDQDWCDLVALGEEVPTPTPRKSSGNHSTGKPGRPHCPLRWFTRGWTLQELIAPSRVQFYDASWLSRGFKNDDDIMPHLSRITGITPRVLENGGEMSLKSVCLGQRMSWAAHRETSRVEDTAYCLMGIFQVNMPLLYGEGNRAFLRFQHEIIKNMTDLSIFAWEPGEATAFSGIFASHPHQFARLGTCELSRSQFSQGSEIAITNKGVRI
ncbi:heterokaryon incompatibility protein-domain-containing protein, partial [Cercophora newfieldiana]